MSSKPSLKPLKHKKSSKTVKTFSSFSLQSYILLLLSLLRQLFTFKMTLLSLTMTIIYFFYCLHYFVWYSFIMKMHTIYKKGTLQQVGFLRRAYLLSTSKRYISFPPRDGLQTSYLRAITQPHCVGDQEHVIIFAPEKPSPCVWTLMTLSCTYSYKQSLMYTLAGATLFVG